MNDSHPASWDLQKLAEACTVRRQRRSGPGGQHRNKVETAIFVEHRDTGITAEACERLGFTLTFDRPADRGLRVTIATRQTSSGR